MIASFVFAKCSQLISQIILARLLSPKDFGVWAMVLVLTNLSILFRDVTIAQVLVHRGLDNKRLVNTVYSLGVNISIGMFFLQALAGFPLSKFFGVPVLGPLTACVALVFLIGAGAGSHGAVLQREMKFKDLAICDSVAGFARVGGALVCAALGFGVWSFAAGEIAMALFDSLLKRALSGYRFTYSFILDSLALREVRSFIGGIVAHNLAVQVNTNGDNLVIGRLLGAQALGYYNVAYQLAMLPVYALSQINRVIFSVLSQQNMEDKRHQVWQSLELYALLSAPLYGVAFVMAPWLIPLLYGSAWVQAVSLFQILLVFAYARGFMAILGTALIALNKPVTNAAINWALVPVSIPSFLIGASLGGTTGVAIAVALVLGIGATAWFWLATCRAAGWKIGLFIEPILLPTIAISAAVAAVLAIPLPAHLHAYVQPLILVFIYGIAVSIFSAGRVPQLLIGVVKHSVTHSRR